MKYVKMLGLLAVAAAAMMAFAASASAITITEAPNDHLDNGDAIVATSEHSQLTGTVPLTCTHSEVKGTVTQAGGVHGTPSTTTDAFGPISSISWGNKGVCNSNATITTVETGELTLEYKETKEDEGGATTGVGTLTSYGAIVTALTHNIFGTTHCIYKTKSTEEGGTHIGTVTEKTLTIHSAPIPQIDTDGLCSGTAEWHGDYKVTSPAGWAID